MRAKGLPGYIWRRLAQLCCLALFILLFLKTDYAGRDELQYAVNILFRLDPLLAASVWLAARTLITLMLPALVTVGLTLIFGRFFCGWACPMGALLDMLHKIMPAKKTTPQPALSSCKFYLLAFLLAGAFFGFPAAGYFDPFSILVRGLALAVHPAANVMATEFFTFTYQEAPAWLNTITEPVYALLKYTVLPFQQKYYNLALLSLAILLTVFLFEGFGRRFFCRNLCPLGALLAILARFALLRGQTGAKCGKCRNCQDICRMGAIDEQKNISSLACNLCLDCVSQCPGNKIAFTFGGRRSHTPVVDLSRRSFTTALAAGATLPFFLRTRSMAKQADPGLIRPPGALPEEDFLGRCVRCGECMKVCIGNGLHPTLLEAGIEGMFSPRLSARIGYCEYNCTLCGQVCPTGAIRKLSIKEKQAVRIGQAVFDKNRCLPFAKAIPCIVCEEHCPTPDKAIKFREARVTNSKGEEIQVLQPYLVDELCIGCGICETKCPLSGEAAVRVTSAGESRHSEKALPLNGGTPY